jgi:peptide/nickel transport system substrate-binding protein
MLFANTTRKPFDDVKVRKALSMAIDRELIVKVAMNNYTRPADATALSDAYASVLDQQAVRAGTWVKHDVASANALLDDAGYKRDEDGIRRTPQGKAFRFDVIVPAGWSDWVRAAQVTARSLKGLGVEANLRTYDFTAWFAKVQTGDYDLSLGWTEEGPTPYKLYRSMMSKHTVLPVGETAESNWHRYVSPTADALLSRFETSSDEAEKKRLLAQLQRAFVEEAPAIPLFLAPTWGEYNTTRFVGFPSKDDPYAKLTPNHPPECLLVMTKVRPRGTPAPASGSAPAASPALRQPSQGQVQP